MPRLVAFASGHWILNPLSCLYDEILPAFWPRIVDFRCLSVSLCLCLLWGIEGSFNGWWLATALLLPFFGGVFFAMSWMGRYAMNELQIEQYGEDEFRIPEKMAEQ